MKKALFFLLLAIFIVPIVPITADELLSQRGMKISVRTETGQTIPLYNKSYALVIGNETYTNGWDPLKSVLRDVKEVATALEKHGFNVTLKTDLKAADFRDAFETFIKNGRDADSRLLFYYAGHGHTETLRTGEELGYLVMIDSPMPTAMGKIDSSKNINMESLVTQAKRIDALHVLYLFDSCFSGSVLNVQNLSKPRVISDSVKLPVRQFITAGRVNEPMPDHSVFKTAFLDMLEGRVNEPMPDGYLTGKELGAYMRNAVSKYNPGQSPQYGKIKDPSLDKGDFVFVLQGKIKLTGTFSISETWQIGTEPIPASRKKTVLSLQSDPSGATVYINDIRVGRTPLMNYEIDTRGKDEEPLIVHLEHEGYHTEDLVLNTPPKRQSAGQIYWISFDRIKDSQTIKRANLDGSNVQNLVTESQLSDIALDVLGGKMYWTKGSKIQRANLDGSNVEDLVTKMVNAGGIALDIAGGKMYWTQGWTKNCEILRANLDGSNIETLCQISPNPWDIALDILGGKMYWTHLRKSAIYRANLDGSNIENIPVITEGDVGGIALDVADGKMYWVTRWRNAGIWRANLDGSNIERLVTGLKAPDYIVLDIARGKMYWTDYREDTPDKIVSADLDGSNVKEVVTAGEFNSSGIALYFPLR